MVSIDQPTCFDSSKVAVAVSSVSDGQMQHGLDYQNNEVTKNRQAFFSNAAVVPKKTVLVGITYSSKNTYDKIVEVDKLTKDLAQPTHQVEPADCLITTRSQVSLLLPIADCVGTVLYDKTNNVLALAHLGRHSSIAQLAKKVVQHLQVSFGTKPSDIVVWMAPSIQSSHYILSSADFAVNNPDWHGYFKRLPEGYSLDLQGYNKQLLLNQGVLENNINISPSNTASNPEYWSHFTQTTIKQQQAPPRFAVVAMLQ